MFKSTIFMLSKMFANHREYRTIAQTCRLSFIKKAREKDIVKSLAGGIPKFFRGFGPIL